MLEVAVKEALSEIKSVTISTISPFIFSSFKADIVKYGYKYFDTYECKTTYLIFVYKNRVLYYGVDSPKKAFFFPMLEEDDDYEATQVQFIPYVFAKRGILSKSELDKVFHSGSDDNLKGLKPVSPPDNGDGQEFFLHNAMWLLNPEVN